MKIDTDDITLLAEKFGVSRSKALNAIMYLAEPKAITIEKLVDAPAVATAPTRTPPPFKYFDTVEDWIVSLPNGEAVNIYLMARALGWPVAATRGLRSRYGRRLGKLVDAGQLRRVMTPTGYHAVANGLPMFTVDRGIIA